MKQCLRRIVLTVLTAAMLISFGTCGAADMRVPVLMYHDLTDDPTQINSMRITGERFRLDMEFLQQFGYTPLLPADLAAIEDGTQQMPAKPVMITFDDGYRSNYDIAYPILKKTGMKAALAVVAGNMRAEDDSDPLRGSLHWGEIREMSESGVFEIGSHTYNLHNPEYKGYGAPDGINGVMRRRGETRSSYTARVGGDLKTGLDLIRQHTGQQKVYYFSFPFGAYDGWMQPLLEKEGIRVTTLTNGGMADLQNGLYSLPRYRMTMDKPLSVLLQQQDKAEPAVAAVSVNGQKSELPAYNINGSNYVRVRDAAMLLAGTKGNFDVQWNGAMQRVELQSGTAYKPLGTENKPLPAGTRRVRSITAPTVADGAAYMIAAYQIEGYTYYKLRSLGELCGFAVEWDSENQMILVNI
ncbi:MAG: polysaccharide deacetylase family protein [Agathobaculum sp.]|jgi:peptidoglycan/xylan/chitin deacetylase (PgdA/CDA1 family)|uniref:polysaccharide deacetylase family protein n=1 Tax=Agathobaculum sp. TaxID=2048138 RepID=UPI003D916166